MTKIYINAIFFCLLNLLFSCSSDRFDKNTIYITTFPKSVSINGFNIDKIDLYSHSNMTIIDTLLILVTSVCEKEHFIHIYCLETFDLIKNFGKEGKGPNDFLSPRIAMNTANSGQNIFIYDATLRRLIKMDIQELIQNANYEITSKVMDSSLPFLSNIIYDNDSIKIGIPGENGRFMIYNKKKRSISYVPYLPEIGVRIHNNNLYPIYHTASFTVSPEKNSFIAMPCLMGQLDFFDFSGNFIKSVVIERVEELKYAKYPEMIFNIPNIRLYYTDIENVDDKLYVLFTTKLYPNLDNPTVSKIFVFDLEGNPIKEYILDREILTFTYDSYHNQFIGYSPLEENNPFILYKLSN